ncbi:MAG: hypothetical protein D6705_09970 [Deltaproteobacteria bacterium]|nr:MAG: hypothetical protein D6705_09970 [Deltaproteobacteria bacterium]
MSLPKEEPRALASRLADLRGHVDAFARKSRALGIDPLAHPIRWARGPLAVATPSEALFAVEDPALARATVVLVTPHADALAALLSAADRTAGAPLPDPALRVAGEAGFEYQAAHDVDDPRDFLCAVLDALVEWAAVRDDAGPGGA